MKVSIFGMGYVGCVSLGCLAKNGHTVIGVDISDVKVKQINSGLPTIIEKDIDLIINEQFKKGNISATTDFKKAVLESDISIIAVGTPPTEIGHLSLEYVFKVAEDIGNSLVDKDDFHIIAVRSTVTPGTTEKVSDIIAKRSGKQKNIHFAVLSNPEFLREGTAVSDYDNPPLTLIGSDFAPAAEKLALLYSTVTAELVITEIKIAEMMKYINNTFHALKVSFANEVGNICSKLQIDAYKVMEIFCKDKELNISPYYLNPGFAYGGSCLPKDLKGLQTLAHDLYVKVPVIESIDKTNAIQIQRAVDFIIGQHKRKLSFLGLSFKAGTDDLRNSPAVAIIETLVGKGYEVEIYDKNINIARLTGTNKQYIDAHIPHLSKLMVDDIDKLLLDNDIFIVNNNENEYNDALLKMGRQVTIIDFVHLSEGVRKRSGYFGINW